MHHADLYRNLHRIHGNMVLSLLWGQLSPKPSLTFHPLQFLSIILLIPGMQFFSGYLTSAVSLLFPNWLSQYEKLMETAGLDSDIGLFMFIYAVILGPVCEELVSAASPCVWSDGHFRSGLPT